MKVALSNQAQSNNKIEAVVGATENGGDYSDPITHRASITVDENKTNTVILATNNRLGTGKSTV